MGDLSSDTLRGVGGGTPNCVGDAGPQPFDRRMQAFVFRNTREDVDGELVTVAVPPCLETRVSPRAVVVSARSGALFAIDLLAVDSRPVGTQIQMHTHP